MSEQPVRRRCRVREEAALDTVARRGAGRRGPVQPGGRAGEMLAARAAAAVHAHRADLVVGTITGPRKEEFNTLHKAVQYTA